MKSNRLLHCVFASAIALSLLCAAWIAWEAMWLQSAIGASQDDLQRELAGAPNPAASRIAGDVTLGRAGKLETALVASFCLLEAMLVTGWIMLARRPSTLEHAAQKQSDPKHSLEVAGSCRSERLPRDS